MSAAVLTLRQCMAPAKFSRQLVPFWVTVSNPRGQPIPGPIEVGTYASEPQRRVRDFCSDLSELR